MTADWKSCGKSDMGDDYNLFRIDDQVATERIKLSDNAWLLVRENGIHVDFACFTFHHSDTDGLNAHHSMLFHGSGPSGSLRECRHIWWGDPDDGGYTYYLNFATVEAAFRELRRWFD